MPRLERLPHFGTFSHCTKRPEVGPPSRVRLRKVAAGRVASDQSGVVDRLPLLRAARWWSASQSCGA